MMATTKNSVLARIVVILHVGFIIFFVLGWLLPKAFLPWHLVAVPLVILHWKLNDDQCILTQWQLKLEGRTLDQDKEGEFIKSLFRKIGVDLSRRQLFWVIYGLLIASGTLSTLRLLSS